MSIAPHVVQRAHLDLEQLQQEVNRGFAFLLLGAAPAMLCQCVGADQPAGGEGELGPSFKDKSPATGRLSFLPAAQRSQLAAGRCGLPEEDEHAHPLRDQPSPALAADVALCRFVEELIGEREQPAPLKVR